MAVPGRGIRIPKALPTLHSIAAFHSRTTPTCHLHTTHPGGSIARVVTHLDDSLPHLTPKSHPVSQFRRPNCANHTEPSRLTWVTCSDIDLSAYKWVPAEVREATARYNVRSRDSTGCRTIPLKARARFCIEAHHRRTAASSVRSNTTRDSVYIRHSREGSARYCNV
jgi:hypothetical protein